MQCLWLESSGSWIPKNLEKVGLLRVFGFFFSSFPVPQTKETSCMDIYISHRTWLPLGFQVTNYSIFFFRFFFKKKQLKNKMMLQTEGDSIWTFFVILWWGSDCMEKSILTLMLQDMLSFKTILVHDQQICMWHFHTANEQLPHKNINKCSLS